MEAVQGAVIVDEDLLLLLTVPLSATPEENVLLVDVEDALDQVWRRVYIYFILKLGDFNVCLSRPHGGSDPH